MNSDPASFGISLRRLRTAAALSQEELAERAGVSARGISDLERGVRRAPHLATVRLLADALALDPADRAALVTAARPETSADSEAGAPARYGPLPVPLTSLVGRERELAEVASLLGRADGRLITLTGTGGTGKTRLALEIGARLGSDFGDGVVFVDLTPLRDADLVLPTIARALGVHDQPGHQLTDTLVRFLAPKRMLLIVDNFEQVLAAASDIATVLAASPRVTLLATSREALRVRGEQVIAVRPLPLPVNDHVADVEELAGVPAVALFVERARARRADFALTTTNAADIAAICRRLDGLPLALELAAARTSVLSPAELLSRLERRLPMLTGGGRDVPERQRTMRNAIAWSYDLLEPADQLLFRRLAVFVGGATFEAIERVANADGDHDAFAGLERLLEHHLVRQEPGPDDGPRFTMLETIREFGLERLSESGEIEKIQRQHAAFFAGLAAEAEPLFLRMVPAQTAWLVRLDPEHPNLRAALTWLLDGDDPDLGLRLAAALFWFWHFRGHFGEGRSWLERALAAAPNAPAIDRANALFGACHLTDYQGDEEQALALGEESLTLFRRIGDRAGIGRALQLMGIVAEDRGDYDRATAFFEEALVLHREDNERYLAAHALRHLGLVTSGRGELDRAAALTEEALALNRELGMTWGVTASLIYLGVIACERGDVRQAATAYAEVLTLSREEGSRQGIARGLVGVATLAAFRDQPAAAARLFGAADSICAALGYRFGLPERAQYDRARAAARGVLGDEGFISAWEAGRDAPVEEAVAEALAAAARVSPTFTRVS